MSAVPCTLTSALVTDSPITRPSAPLGAVLQIATVERSSALAVASSRPSGRNATASIRPACARSVTVEDRSHSSARPSTRDSAKCRPSGLAAQLPASLGARRVASTVRAR